MDVTFNPNVATSHYTDPAASQAPPTAEEQRKKFEDQFKELKKGLTDNDPNNDKTTKEKISALQGQVYQEQWKREDAGEMEAAQKLDPMLREMEDITGGGMGRMGGPS